MQTNNPWIYISAPENSLEFNTMRVEEVCDHNFWWIVDCVGKPGLGIEFNTEISLSYNVPSFSSFEIKLSKNNKFLLLFLIDLEVNTKFRVLCQDLINEANSKTNIDGVEFLNHVMNTLKRWQRLFNVKKNNSPTLPQKLGLLGELNCLVNLIAKNVGFRAAVDAWQGPKGHEQDFLINGHLIEIKAQMASLDRVVKINSLEQLDTTSGPIWLQHLGLSPISVADSTSISINMLIQRILDGLVGDNLGIDIFITLLELQGFQVQNDYGDEVFRTSFVKIYQVREDFPKLTRKLIGSNAVVKANYSINMSELDPWIVDEEYIKARAFS